MKKLTFDICFYSFLILLLSSAWVLGYRHGERVGYSTEVGSALTVIPFVIWYFAKAIYDDIKDFKLGKILPIKFSYSRSCRDFGPKGIELKGSALHAFDGKYGSSKKIGYLSGAYANEQWATFRKYLDSIKVWDWKDDPEKGMICDGGIASFEIEYSDRKAFNIVTQHDDTLDWSLLKNAIAWTSDASLYYGDEYDLEDELDKDEIKGFTQSDNEILPIKFLYSGSSKFFWEIELKGSLIYIHEDDGSTERTTCLHGHPSIEEWVTFRKFLDSIKVWDWKDDPEKRTFYNGDTEGVSLEIEYSDGKAINLETHYDTLKWSLLENAIAWISNLAVTYDYEYDLDG
ncbi:MAG: hypothetical protein ACJ0BK_00680 [Coraliomargaritaceae bacterium]